MLKPDDKVTVYNDYWTGQRKEGCATLIRLLDNATEQGEQRWHVVFDGDEPDMFVWTLTRFIRVDKFGNAYWGSKS